MDSSLLAANHDFIPMSKPEILAILVSSKLLGKEDLSERAYDMIRNMTRNESSSHLHDTSLLLQQYRYIRYAVNANTYVMANASAGGRGNVQYQEMIDSLKASMDEKLDLGAGRIGRANSKAKSLLYCVEFLRIVDDTLEILRQRPNKGQLFHKVLYYTFIDQEINSYTDKQCGFEAVRTKLENDGEFLSQTTYYRYKRQAIEAISPILMGHMSDEMLQNVLSFGIRYL